MHLSHTLEHTHTNPMSQKLYITLNDAPEDQPYRKEITTAEADQCVFLKDLINEEEECEMPLSSISPVTMDKVMVWLKHHAGNPMTEVPRPITTNVLKDIVGEWDAAYIDLAHDQETLVDIILAANFLSCKPLLDLGLCQLACMIKDKTPEEAQTILNIDGDITPEEMQLVRDENPWVKTLGRPKAKVESA